MPTHSDLPSSYANPKAHGGLLGAFRAWRERRRVAAFFNADDEPVESYRDQAANPELLLAEQEVNEEP